MVGEKVHRALADGSRARIVEELRAETGLDARELAGRLGLHANTVRWHLGVLADAGLVSARRAERTTPGRPRTIYALRPSTASGPDEFRLLASVLTTALAEDGSAVARSEAAGARWGRYLAPRRSPLSTASESEAIEAVSRVLDEQGFAPETEGREVRLHRCPFLDLAEEHPEVVCSVHKGLMSGVLDETGADLDVELTPFVAPDLCIARLMPRR